MTCTFFCQYGIIKKRIACHQRSDIIIGNPPWLKWSSLPAAYRETIKEFCRDYGLFSSDKFYGGVESDVSTMVLYSAAEKWLRLNGVLAMLITRSVFKTESAEGFRKFRIPGNRNIKFQVQKVEDFTLLRPFQDAVNKPALLVLKKGFSETAYPLPWMVWDKKAGQKITDKMYLDTVMVKVQIAEKAAAPVGNREGGPWLTVSKEELSTCRELARIDEGEKYYGARKGMCMDCNGVSPWMTGRKRNIYVRS